jgi:beta-glucanase (GH16 family)
VTRHAALRLWLAGTALAAGLGLADASHTEAHHRPGHRPGPTATPTPTPAPLPTPGGAPTLLFSDDFDGTVLDPAKWRTGFWYCAAGQPCDPNSGSVLHVNHPRNCVVSDGLLRLTAKREPTTFNGKSFGYTSCVATTGRIGGNTGAPLFEYRYGYAEVSLKAAPGVGMWSGLWFLRQWCDGCGNLQEVDAPEVLGNTPTLARYHWHGPAGTFGYNQPAADLTADFHTYGLEWLPGIYRFYLDGTQVWEVLHSQVNAQPAYVLLDLNVGACASWAGCPDAAFTEAEHQVDWIKVFDRRN